jgi:phosphoribosylanthranilate isomerase
MGRTLVKICGLRDAEAARAALDVGADYVGFVFAPSRRRVSVEEARAIIRTLPVGAPTVGVFVNEPAERVNEVVAACGLACAQLSGDEPPEVVAAVRGPVLKALRVRGPETAAELERYRGGVSLFVLDAFAPGAYGGTGQTCDWSAAAESAARHPCLLAGGLTPENVGAAIAAVRPRGVDVSGGVEVGGRKDARRIAAFVEAVRRADRCER